MPQSARIDGVSFPASGGVQVEFTRGRTPLPTASGSGEFFATKADLLAAIDAAEAAVAPFLHLIALAPWAKANQEQDGDDRPCRGAGGDFARLMPRSVAVAKIERGGGRLAVRFADKHGLIFSSVAGANAIFDSFADSVTDEIIFLIGARKVGLANVETLEGKTITLSLDVTIA
jgi:hypothetical protein